MKISIRSIYTDLKGFERIIKLYHTVQARHDGTLEINMAGVDWMDANMCAPFGAILFHFVGRGNIRLFKMRHGLRNELSINGFLTNFGFDVPREKDLEGTTIEYQRFEIGKTEVFREYIAKHFVGKGIPNMSEALHKKFRESIAELYQNAVDHSSTGERGIFACGQYFPKQNRLDFSIVDLGIGMRKNIFNELGLDLTSKEAIRWTLQENNTTKKTTEGRPGGLGLKLIKEFITLNGGKILIVSDSGYWCFHDNKESLRTLCKSFPGTIVNIEINTADKRSYCLAEEVDPNSIF